MHKTRLKQVTVNQLYSLTMSTGREPVLLLGAGASVTSGVPLAGDMAMQALRWAMAMQKGWDPKDPRIRDTDVRTFLKNQAWYDPEIKTEDLYQMAMHLVNTPRELRRSFLMDILNTVSEPSKGYGELVSLVKKGGIRTILTTNFDDRFESAFGSGPIIKVANRPEFRTISTSPAHPQLIYLHGRAEHYMDRNTSDEVEELDAELVRRLSPILRDHPLIVVGYRGAEPSIMRDLLIDQIEGDGETFKQGIFWCIVENYEDYTAPAMVNELAEKISDNFAVVEIPGFDEFMADLARISSENPPKENSLTSAETNEGGTFDMQMASKAFTSDMNWGLAHSAAEEYCRRMNIPAPNEPTDEWYEEILIRMGILRRDKNKAVSVSNAGAILFCDKTVGRNTARGHWVEVSTPNRPPKSIDGPLPVLFENVYDILEQENKPVRVKGIKSREEHPYGPIAIKELLANALVHRDYEDSGPVRVSVGKDGISFENPGGLDSQLMNQISRRDEDRDEKEISREFTALIEKGHIGPSLASYRNPIIAEAFWALGYVDKAGSGLTETVQSLKDIDADFIIDVQPRNRGFRATISPKHIDINSATGTAMPVRPSIYYSNLVEFKKIPSKIWVARARLNSYREATPLGGERAIPFALYQENLYTYHELAGERSQLSAFIDKESTTQIDTKDLSENDDTQRIVAELLRKALEAHMKAKGLWVERRRQRCHFTCDRNNRVQKSYQSGGRQLSRRVAWWNDDSQRYYCIHKAVSYEIKRFKEAWGLILNPTFLVTQDGRADQLDRDEHSRIVTGLQSDHYNSHVRADVRFWLSFLETGDGEIDLSYGGSRNMVVDTHTIQHEGYSRTD